MLEHETQFSSQVASEGIVNAYQDYSADDIRYYRMGKLPVVGKENVCNKVKDESATMFWKPMASDVAKSGDFGYTYSITTLILHFFARKSSNTKTPRNHKEHKGKSELLLVFLSLWTL